MVGLKLKVALAACWLTWFFNFSYRMFVPALIPAIKAELELTELQAGLMISVLSLGYATSLGASGLLTLGLRDEVVIALSLSIATASFILTTASTGPEWLAVSLFIAGVGLGLYLPSAISLLSSLSPPPIKGRVLGVHETGAPLGQVAGPLIAGFILLAGLPWKLSIPYWALLSTPLALFFYVQLKGGPKLRNVPERLAKPRGFSAKFFISFLVTYMCMAAGTGLLMVMPLYITESFKLPAALAAFIIGLSRLAGVLGQLLCGFLSDKIGRFKVLLSTTAITLASASTLVASSYGALFIFSLLIMAASHNAFFPVAFALTTDIFKGSTRLLLSLMISPGLFLGAGLVPYIFGWLAEFYGYYTAILFPLAIMTVSLPASILTYFTARNLLRN
ncbi:MAG: MFS transporter [Candidatus Nezhaarchaeota archaeon]|nr:MFS transporter [Candidatus Nezhaarchaeota archaeon]